MSSRANERQGLVRLLSRRNTAEVKDSEAPTDEPLSAFLAEGSEPRSAPTPAPTKGAGNQRIGWMLGAGITAAIVVSVVAITQMRAAATRSPNENWGKLTVDSRPAGAVVLVDGEQRGVTPLTLSLKPGEHAMGIVSGGEEKRVPLAVASGVTLSQYYEFAAPVPAPARVGKLSISSDPTAARIQVDGKTRGSAPLLLADLEPGEHVVSATGETGSVDRKVTVEAGMTASLVFSLPKVAGPAAGWLAVSSPFDVQVYDNTDLIGTGGAAKIMVPAGRHDVRVVSQALGYDDTRRIDVAAGKTATIRIDPPKVTISANARPWANVTIDDEAVGQTPLSNVSIAIGTHQVVFRHPQLGEQRQTIVVTVKGPNRISADMTKK